MDTNIDMNALSAIVSQLAANPEIAKLTGGKAPTVTPEMMSSLPSIMQAIAPALENAKKEPQVKPDGEICDSECRKRLLIALKPYLSEGRREALDSILAVSQLGDILSGFDKSTDRST